MIRVFSFTPLILAWALMLPQAVSAQPETAEAKRWLGQMAQSNRELSYQGLFTYEHGIALETFKLTRWVDQGAQYERLEHLSGPEREVLRQGLAADCQSAGDQVRHGRLTLSDGQVADLGEYYYLDMAGQERVAGRSTRQVQIIPRDTYRYGYLLDVDEDTGLLLRSLLIDEQRRVLERFQFVDIQLAPAQAEIRLEPRAQLFRQANAHPSPCNPTALTQPDGWHLDWLPPGFVFSGQQTVQDDTEMLMYTDGLSTFSVFLAPADGDRAIEGRAQRGATNAYMGQVAAGERRFRVTVVGEVPVQTAEQVANGIVAEGAQP
ncbi:MucB/RseB C-terminal domain-containing protein [Marinimicrobium alkaliphilum]|uniref:MucB/RseB C-terminal domain-containing protein n=1 Tax=Marinimicrobium alkaliphilum TaxID=2202654 RepID=UPI000DBA3B0F|nr:MucB/RseB C-terminal domain-containing protein [Marinimicrobium alkaliphilum]